MYILNSIAHSDKQVSSTQNIIINKDQIEFHAKYHSSYVKFRCSFPFACHATQHSQIQIHARKKTVFKKKLGVQKKMHTRKSTLHSSERVFFSTKCGIIILSCVTGCVRVCVCAYIREGRQFENHFVCNVHSGWSISCASCLRL